VNPVTKDHARILPEADHRDPSPGVKKPVKPTGNKEKGGKEEKRILGFSLEGFLSHRDPPRAVLVGQETQRVQEKLSGGEHRWSPGLIPYSPRRGKGKGVGGSCFPWGPTNQKTS